MDRRRFRLSRSQDDDEAALKEQSELVTGEPVAALDAVEPESAKGREAGVDAWRSVDREGGAPLSRERDEASEMEPSYSG